MSVSGAILLVVIAATQVFGSPEEREQRQAQTTAERLAAAFTAGKTAGIRSFYETEQGIISTADEVVKVVSTGAIAMTGAFKGKYFGLPGLPEHQYAAALNYLEWDSESLLLRYLPDGSAQ